MQRTTHTPEPLDAAALRLYRHAVALTATAAELREAALQLVQAAAAARADVEPAPVAAPKQIEAVARGGRAIGQRVADASMGAVRTERPCTTPRVVTGHTLDLERANEELQAVARYGVWQPGPKRKERV
jgi:hypothetical protein